ncbi:hypothetical protein AVEN_270786-1 [Araneus ventricosus]|uniref:Uncharacterized protein n=1 Tax=Araneus ventricosus TaxID=182803 RepID=A0A4Y2I0F9_ARAVE|nr:hypothetical protein AVEN_270786-1 [Araneus ventricosus]
MDSDVFDYEPRNVADSNERNDVSFLNKSDQVSNLESTITETKRISRNSFSNEKDWERNTAKINRMQGKAYMVFRRADPKTTKRIGQDVPREERTMGLACNFLKRGCDTIPEQERKSLFDEFWFIMSWDLKKIVVCRTVDIKSTKQKTVNVDGRRQRMSSLFPISTLRD